MSQNDSNLIQNESNKDLILNKSDNSKEEEPIVEETKEEKKLIEEQNNNKYSKNNSARNNSNSNESRENSNLNENSDEKNKIKLKDDEIMVEVMDRGVNTDELNASELERLVKQNKELKGLLNDDKGNILNKNSIFNIEHNTSEIPSKKKKLIEELTKNDEIKELLTKQNKELSNKIKLSEKKFQDIMSKIGEKKEENTEELKDKIDFKEGIERASNLQKVIKEETLKNIELKDKLNTLNKINKFQSKYMEDYQKKYKIKEKEELLTKEINQNKKLIKDYNNKYLKLERFIKAAHEKITSVRIFVGKIINEPKKEEKKIFTNEETKDTLEIITNLKAQINEKRKELDEIQKKSESRMHEILVQNKQIEMDYLENKRIYRSLLFKRNEINKKLRKLKKNNMSNRTSKHSNENTNANNINDKSLEKIE